MGRLVLWYYILRKLKNVYIYIKMGLGILFETILQKYPSEIIFWKCNFLKPFIIDNGSTMFVFKTKIRIHVTFIF